MSATDLRGQIDLLLLSVLVAEPAHGYRVIERLREQSEGTVYPALHRLERSGLLESHWSDDAPRRRRVYAVTQAGRGSLATRRRDWAAFAGAMQAVIAR